MNYNDSQKKGSVKRKGDLLPDERYTSVNNKLNNEGGLSVKRQDDFEPIGKMLWRWKKKIYRFGFWDEIKKRKFYVKPSTRKRAKEKERKFNQMLINRMHQN